MSLRRFFWGLLIGCTTGAIVALLYAPQRGTATRRTLVDTATSMGDRVTGIATSVKDKVHDTAVAIKQAI